MMDVCYGVDALSTRIDGRIDALYIPNVKNSR
jgi:hypothetical protein